MLQIVVLAGPSASGKSLTAAAIIDSVPAAVLGQVTFCERAFSRWRVTEDGVYLPVIHRRPVQHSMSDVLMDHADGLRALLDSPHADVLDHVLLAMHHGTKTLVFTADDVHTPDLLYAFRDQMPSLAFVTRVLMHRLQTPEEAAGQQAEALQEVLCERAAHV